MTDAIDELAEEVADRILEWDPFEATTLGERAYDDEVPERSDAARDEQRRIVGDLIERVGAVDIDACGADDRTTIEVARHELAAWRNRLDGRWEEFQVGAQFGGAHIDVLQTVPKITIRTEQHAADYVERCRQLGRYLDQAADDLRRGVANGRTPPARAVQTVVDQLDGYLQADLSDDPLMAPVPADDVATAAALTDLIRGGIRPAVARYRDVLADEVLPRARPDERPGIGALDGGEELYRRALAEHTTTELPPEEIHQLGLRIVDGLADEYRELGGAVLGTTDLGEIFSRLRDDPALRFDSEDAVREAAESALRRAEEAVPDWFRRLPQAPCEVREVPAHEAADSTIAYYLPPAMDGSRPGIYYVNTYAPATRTRFESEALAFHESVPGHHLQIAIAQELDVPRLRRISLITAYVEGWALYTERLCDEMGLYADDLSRLGMLSFDSWRACRLVVDTGIHAMGWSRQAAVDYLRRNSPQALNNIENEVDRYISWPGQACGYMVGRREIRRLRETAHDDLGTRFDIRGFHDTVLSQGAVPLTTLDRLVHEWVDGRANGDRPGDGDSS